MAEKQYAYKTTIKQPQTVAGVKLDPKGGCLSERDYKTLKKDVYGASLLEKGLLVFEKESVQTPGPSGNIGGTENTDTTGDTGTDGEASGETIPDFEEEGGASADRPQEHAGWKPE